MDLETTVKLSLYNTIATTGRIPDSSEVSSGTGFSIHDVEAAFQQLFQKRLLVLEPGTKNRIRMAPPFSGIETQHRVTIAGIQYYANCAWDAFGIAAALHQDADIDSTCGDCDESMFFQIQNQQPILQDSVIHFAVPAANWWKDIIYT